MTYPVCPFVLKEKKNSHATKTFLFKKKKFFFYTEYPTSTASVGICYIYNNTRLCKAYNSVSVECIVFPPTHEWAPLYLIGVLDNGY